jgi:hypothetical protein
MGSLPLLFVRNSRADLLWRGIRSSIKPKGTIINATTVAVDLANSVFQLVVADEHWRIVETQRLTNPQFERWFVLSVSSDLRAAEVRPRLDVTDKAHSMNRIHAFEHISDTTHGLR